MSNYSEGDLNLEAKNTTWTKVYGYVPAKSTVLDFGCSDGRLGAALKKRKRCTVYGVEIDEGDFEKATEVLDGTYNFNIEREPIPQSLVRLRFDAIILADVIEHFVDPVESLKKLKKLLKPEGRLIFSIPNMSHISVRLQLLDGQFDYAPTGLLDSTHLHFYTFNEVTRVFTNAGFKIIHNNANSLPYPPSFLKKKMASLGLADKGFIERIQNDIYAQSFQFVGYCQMTSDRVIKQIPLSTKTPEQELIAYIDTLSQDKRGNQKVIDELRAQNDSLEKELQRMRREMAELTSTILGRLNTRLHRTKPNSEGK